MLTRFSIANPLNVGSYSRLFLSFVSFTLLTHEADALCVIYLDTVLVTMTKATYKRACVCRDYRFKRLESMTIMAGSVAASGLVLELRLKS